MVLPELMGKKVIKVIMEKWGVEDTEDIEERKDPLDLEERTDL